MFCDQTLLQHRIPLSRNNFFVLQKNTGFISFITAQPGYREVSLSLFCFSALNSTIVLHFPYQQADIVVD